MRANQSFVRTRLYLPLIKRGVLIEQVTQGPQIALVVARLSLIIEEQRSADDRSAQQLEAAKRTEAHLECAILLDERSQQRLDNARLQGRIDRCVAAESVGQEAGCCFASGLGDHGRAEGVAEEGGEDGGHELMELHTGTGSGQRSALRDCGGAAIDNAHKAQ